MVDISLPSASLAIAQVHAHWTLDKEVMVTSWVVKLEYVKCGADMAVPGMWWICLAKGL